MKVYALTLLLASAFSAHAADVYRWVDSQGKVHYSDQPPPAAAKDVQQKKFGGNTIDVDTLPFAAREAMKKHPVTLYTTNCGEPCSKAQELLAKRGIPFTVRNPESSKADMEALRKLAGALQVPVLVVGSGAPIKGFEEGAYTAALDAAGYPRSNPLRQPAKPPAQAAEPTKQEAASPARPAKQ